MGSWGLHQGTISFTTGMLCIKHATKNAMRNTKVMTSRTLQSAYLMKELTGTYQVNSDHTYEVRPIDNFFGGRVLPPGRRIYCFYQSLSLS